MHLYIHIYVFTFMSAVILQVLLLGVIGVNGKPIKFNIAEATVTTTKSIAIVRSSIEATTQ